MSCTVFREYAVEVGLVVQEQSVLSWGGFPKLDCLTNFKKPWA